MAECAIDCTIDSPEVSGTTSTAPILIPVLPAGVDPITIPTAQTVTEEVVSGAGVFDVYMRAGMAQLDTQYKEGRIKGSDYANAYIQTMQLMMTEANKLVLGLVQAEIAAKMFNIQYMTAAYDAALKEYQAIKTREETSLLVQQREELKANGSIERALKIAQKQTQVKQAELYSRQIKGFNEKASNDALKTIMDSWAVSAVEEPQATVYGTGYEEFSATAQKTQLDALAAKALL